MLKNNNDMKDALSCYIKRVEAIDAYLSLLYDLIRFDKGILEKYDKVYLEAQWMDARASNQQNT